MQYRYIVQAEMNHFNEVEIKKDLEANCSETYEIEFINRDPFLARAAAFRRAKAFEETFQDRELSNNDPFFIPENKWYNEYSISVFFSLGKEIEIHNTKYVDDIITSVKGKKAYNTLSMRRKILEGLSKEFEILKKKKISTANSIKVEAIFLPKKEKKQFTIFPTEIINQEKIIFNDAVFN